MTRYTLLGAGHAGMEVGVRVVVAGGDGWSDVAFTRRHDRAAAAAT